MFLYKFINLFIILTYSFARDLEFLLFHVNDMQSRFKEIKGPRYTQCRTGKDHCFGGFARVAHVVRSAKEKARSGEGPPVIFLNAGGTSTGSVWYYAHGINITSDLLNRLEVDVGCLGSHEFDNEGYRGVNQMLDAVKFPLIASNIDDIRLKKLRKSAVISVNGYKIGVIGYITPKTQQISKAADLVIADEVESVNLESMKLRRDGIKTIIALGHSGFQIDKTVASSCLLVDIVVGGRSRTFLWNGPAPDIESVEGPYPIVIEQRRGKKVPVVQAFSYTKYIGQLHVTVNTQTGRIKGWKGNPILLDSTVPQDDDILALIDNKYRTKVQVLEERKCGETKVVLEGDDLICRKAECNMANMITDAYIDFHAREYKGPYWTDAAIAIINGGAIKQGIPVGNIVEADLAAVMPYRDQIVALTLSGKDLVEVLQFSASQIDVGNSGQFLQYSGIQVKYDKRKKPRRRMLSAHVRCADCEIPHYERLRKDKYYRILAPGYLANGGDGYVWISQNKKNTTFLSKKDVDIIMKYLENKELIYPAKENRIIILGASSISLAKKIIFFTHLIILYFNY